MTARAGTAGPLEWAVAGRALSGQLESGDAALVLDRGGDVLLAVVDGLGHGPDAAAAARAACGALSATPGDLEALFQACHRAEAKERGAAMSAALVDPDGWMTWAGVGNVEGVVVRALAGLSSAHERLLMKGGVVGGAMPPLRQGRLELRHGDTVVLATDGIDEEAAQSCDARPPDLLAAHLLERHGKASDDALVLVARWAGGPR